MANLALSSPTTTSEITDRARLFPALGAAVLGLVILFGAGFAPSEVVHNAAHDTRHSAAFPCH